MVAGSPSRRRASRRRATQRSQLARTLKGKKMTYRDGASEQCGPFREIDVLWVTAGLGCDGDTIAITAATQPSLEEIVQGAIPGIPKVNSEN